MFGFGKKKSKDISKNNASNTIINTTATQEKPMYIQGINRPEYYFPPLPREKAVRVLDEFRKAYCLAFAFAWSANMGACSDQDWIDLNKANQLIFKHMDFPGGIKLPTGSIIFPYIKKPGSFWLIDHTGFIYRPFSVADENGELSEIGEYAHRFTEENNDYANEQIIPLLKQYGFYKTNSETLQSAKARKKYLEYQKVNSSPERTMIDREFIEMLKEFDYFSPDYHMSDMELYAALDAGFENKRKNMKSWEHPMKADEIDAKLWSLQNLDILYCASSISGSEILSYLDYMNIETHKGRLPVFVPEGDKCRPVLKWEVL